MESPNKLFFFNFLHHFSPLLFALNTESSGIITISIIIICYFLVRFTGHTFCITCE
jgi:steroid 5-alpha reductase family enzyme